MDSIFKKVSREVLVALVFFLPVARRVRFERWLRGREETRRLERADVVIVSFGKSGRTWLRVMISRYYQLVYGLSDRSLLGFENYHRRNAKVPKIFFTHDTYIKDYTGEYDTKASFYGKKVILMVRNPKDIAVSQYFQWKHRMRPSKAKLNQYPPKGADVSPYEFVMDPNCGLPNIINYLNLWAREASHVERLLIVRYEDMRSDPNKTLRRVMEFIHDDASASPASDTTDSAEWIVPASAIDGAVEYSSVENMRKLEERNVFWLAGGRMRPGKKGDRDTYKVRRAKVDGYKDYFDAVQTVEIDRLVSEGLASTYGYDAPPKPDLAAHS